MSASGTSGETRVTFSLAGFWRGMKASGPLGVSVFAYGIAFGLFAKSAEMSMAEALLMSGLVYSGSAQMAAVSAMGNGVIPSGAAAFAVVTTILLLNARYLLYGASLRGWLCQVSGLQAYATLAVLGDGNWALSMKRHAEGEQDAGFVLGSGVIMFVPWLFGTAFGLLTAGVAANPTALGLDFMLVAFSTALAVGMFKGRTQMPVLLAAIAASTIADRLLPPGWAVMSAGLTGGLTAWLLCKPEEQP
ncbi:MAG: AzlC family ABC transporter permease [Methylocystis sp.]|nr:AzlC family ABC transporter permease [Methylocystis sp.]MCA3584593.1 AzlC family ABC transporter permease [Methylocystis sp.]MCA3589027.1 AzlC family ABC transporter permease [Methylocystis sp.]MCA3593102.1 AzlC family ABC transporter permease [Methylocystis sp.]